jgi:hypothetical protein
MGLQTLEHTTRLPTIHIGCSINSNGQIAAVEDDSTA